MFDVGFFESKARSLIKISFKISKNLIGGDGRRKEDVFFFKDESSIDSVSCVPNVCSKIISSFVWKQKMCCSFCLTKAQTGRLQSINKIFHT